MAVPFTKIQIGDKEFNLVLPEKKSGGGGSEEKVYNLYTSDFANYTSDFDDLTTDGIYRCQMNAQLGSYTQPIFQAWLYVYNNVQIVYAVNKAGCIIFSREYNGEWPPFTQMAIPVIGDNVIPDKYCTYSSSKIEELLDNKQDKLAQGDNITIVNNKISASVPKYEPGDGIEINNNTISVKKESVWGIIR